MRVQERDKYFWYLSLFYKEDWYEGKRKRTGQAGKTQSLVQQENSEYYDLGH